MVVNTWETIGKKVKLKCKITVFSLYLQGKGLVSTSRANT